MSEFTCHRYAEYFNSSVINVPVCFFCWQAHKVKETTIIKNGRILLHTILKYTPSSNCLQERILAFTTCDSPFLLWCRKANSDSVRFVILKILQRATTSLQSKGLSWCWNQVWTLPHETLSDTATLPRPGARQCNASWSTHSRLNFNFFSGPGSAFHSFVGSVCG